MKQNHSFFRNVCNLAIPVALQSMLQSSFGIVDQIMIGQLGSVNIAGVGLAVKFSGIFSVVVAALGAVAGIMISQYLGQQDRIEVKRSFFLNLYFALGLAALFTALCLLSPGWIMGFSPAPFSPWPARPCCPLCYAVWKRPLCRYMPAFLLLPSTLP